MDVTRLNEIISLTTTPFRKGKEVNQRVVEGMRVIEVYAMPMLQSELVDALEPVDCHYFVVAVDKELAQKHRDEVVAILQDWPKTFNDQPLTPLEEGPSYILAGAVLGDQGQALQLFALGQVLGLWKVITPETFGVTGEEADDLAGSGFVLTDGFRK